MVQNSANPKDAFWIASLCDNPIPYFVSLTEVHRATQMIPHCLSHSSLCSWCWVKVYSSFKILVKWYFIWIGCHDLQLSGAFNHTFLYRTLLYSMSFYYYMNHTIELEELHIFPFSGKNHSKLLFKYDLKF